MTNHIAHFAIHAADVERARGFYEQVFGWTFDPWGPPGFFMITAGDGIRGSLQAREAPLGSGGLGAFECTVAVADVEAVGPAIETAGGKIVAPLFSIPGVGRVVKFEDTEGNVACAMQYEEGVA